MSSRGIVSAKSEIPGNRHHWMIAVPSHSAVLAVPLALAALRGPRACGGIAGLQK